MTNNTEEIWKTINDFPNYEVSTYGRVRNKKTGYIIRQLLGSNGYFSVRIRKHSGDCEKPSRLVHRLVAEAFLGGNHPNLQVNHKDGNKQNNNVKNLEWCTRKENSQHAMSMGLFDPMPPDPPKRKVKIVETGEVFNSIRECANTLNVAEQHIWACLNGKRQTRNGLHFEYVDDEKPQKPPFLYDYQMDAVKKMRNGCILNGGVGSGKSRTGLYYYFSRCGGSIDPNYIPMSSPKDLFIITTAMKRNLCEWEGELAHYLISPNKEASLYNINVVIDSWNNIKKYADVKDCFFIFDEDRVTGSGAWVKAFQKIAKQNEWIILSATAGDTWMDYCPVFVANNFYKNRTEFIREHVIYSRFTKYPKIDRYVNTGRLVRLRNLVLVDMDFKRHTVSHHEDIYVQYDIQKYKDAGHNRWDPFKDEPIVNAAGLCYVWRRIVNSDESRQVALMELAEKHPRMIVFYSFDYERDILLNLYYGEDVEIAEWSGHAHQPIPESDKWIYLVNYVAGAEGWNSIKTDTIVFYSQTYSYKTLEQASGRINRLNSPFTDLYYYHLKSRSGIDLAISKALRDKRNFNEGKFVKW